MIQLEIRRVGEKEFKRTSLVVLLGLLLLGLLGTLGSLGVDVVSEGTLEELGIELVDDVNINREEDTGGLGVEESVAKEGQSGAQVHRVAGDVEGESRKLLALQDTEVVTKVGSINAKTVVSSQNKGLSDDIEGNRGGLEDGLVLLRDGNGRLDAQGVVVNKVTSDAEGEDDDGKNVAGDVLVSAENLTHDAGLELQTTNNIPEGGVEEDETSGKQKGLVGVVHVLGHLAQEISRHFSSFCFLMR